MTVRDWGTFRVHVGDCIDSMRTMEAGSVQTCITSPPYFGLRDYGCEGQIGMEVSPDLFVMRLVSVFREVWRVLRDDGTLWLNLGDSYASSGGQGKQSGDQFKDRARGKEHITKAARFTGDGLKSKDLIGIPWRVAFALQADGWYLRQDIIWAKPNPMPESTTDRCTKAHEYVFLLSKNDRYVFDYEAIKEPASGKSPGNKKPEKGQAAYEAGDERHRTKAGLLAAAEKARAEGGFQFRRKRSVWTVPSAPFADAHFATFPPALIEPCVLAGSKHGDTILDPFGGAGTTALVATKHGRIGVLCELNPGYANMAEKRVATALYGPGEILW